MLALFELDGDIIDATLLRAQSLHCALGQVDELVFDVVERDLKGPGQGAPVTWVSWPRGLPTEEGAELGVLQERVAWSPHFCRDATHVKLAFQPAVAPVVDMGLFHAQCHICRHTTTSNPKGIGFRCDDDLFGVSSLFIYQLGDDLYFTDDGRIRRVPLPCGAEVEYHADEFLRGLGLDP